MLKDPANFHSVLSQSDLTKYENLSVLMKKSNFEFRHHDLTYCEDQTAGRYGIQSGDTSSTTPLTCPHFIFTFTLYFSLYSFDPQM